MKIKKKRGPKEYLQWMDYRSKHPRVHKLFKRRQALLDYLTTEPGRHRGIDRMILKIDRELGSLRPSLEKEGYELTFGSYPWGS